MANEVHRKLLVAVTAFDFDTAFAEIDGVANGDLIWSAPVTNAEDCDFVDVFASLKTGTSPTAGGRIEFYVGRADDDTPEIRPGTDDITTTDHGEETVDADITRVLGALGHPLATIVVDGTSDKTYRRSFRVWYPGADWNLFIYNASGAAFNGTSSPHRVTYRGWGPEIQ